MRIAGTAVVTLLLFGVVTLGLLAQTPGPMGPTYDVVSIKRTEALPTSPPVERPDGGFRMMGASATALINRAFPSPAIPTDRVGLPAWASTERYDVAATSTLTRATAEDRMAMTRAMLFDRFKLSYHFEKVEQPVYDLVLARSDGRLGQGMTRIDLDCDRILAERAAAAEAASAAGTPPDRSLLSDLTAPPPCYVRTIGAMIRDMRGDRQGRLGDLLEGDTTLDNLAQGLRMSTGRFVINKTGLPGAYRVRMNFNMMAGRGLNATAPTTPDAVPDVFTAVQEQLGLRLRASRAEGERLVVDRLEHPTED
jgi:uncharacterized protein (TIGR03435 family)